MREIYFLCGCREHMWGGGVVTSWCNRSGPVGGHVVWCVVLCVHNLFFVVFFLSVFLSFFPVGGCHPWKQAVDFRILKSTLWGGMPFCGVILGVCVPRGGQKGFFFVNKKGVVVDVVPVVDGPWWCTHVYRGGGHGVSDRFVDKCGYGGMGGWGYTFFSTRNTVPKIQSFIYPPGFSCLKKRYLPNIG